MKRILLKSLLILFIIFISLLSGLYIYFKISAPVYSGKLQIPILQNEVIVYHDDIGAPHIYAQNESDAYTALGYLHAQERLFQMEMMRLVAKGRLSEFLGEGFIDADRFFRSLNIPKTAKESAALYQQHEASNHYKATQAYLQGLNFFVEHGKTPLEYGIMGLTKEKYSIEDIYCITGYMAFSFAEGFKTDPMMQFISNNLGNSYLKDINMMPLPSDLKIEVDSILKTSNPSSDSTSDYSALSVSMNNIMNQLPLSIWLGSNCWVLGGEKTTSGKPILANDTHIKFGQPSVWWEAHLEYPGFRSYGNYLAGFPFPLVGHTDAAAWGLTMFENDDLDFFIEKENPENPEQYWAIDQWKNYDIRSEKILIKNKETEIFEIKSSRHGPVVNPIMNSVNESTKNPVSLWWAFTNFNCRVLEAAYGMSQAQNIQEASDAIAMIDAPGLNVTYAFANGDFAWWAAGRIPIYPKHVNPSLFLDGSSGKDDYLGFYDFENSPRNINPKKGFLANANNQPEAIHDTYIPGYYAPENRAKRIDKLLRSKDVFSVDDVKNMMLDTKSDVFEALNQEICEVILSEKQNLQKSELEIFEILKNWDGNHHANQIEPPIFYQTLYLILKYAMEDELGEKNFSAFHSLHVMKSSYASFLRNDSSIWWNNIQTENIESRQDIFVVAFKKAAENLINNHGENPENWLWGKLHTLTHEHPLGSQKPLDKIFNVGAFEAPGGLEVINNLSFALGPETERKVSYGPAMRRVIDMSNLDNTFSILPTGQSGNASSSHFQDQAQMYVDGVFRPQLFNKSEIEKLNQKFILHP